MGTKIPIGRTALSEAPPVSFKRVVPTSAMLPQGWPLMYTVTALLKLLPLIFSLNGVPLEMLLTVGGIAVTTMIPALVQVCPPTDTVRVQVRTPAVAYV
jgi:hypothetical protein